MKHPKPVSGRRSFNRQVKAKIPVGNQPICPDDAVRRIDPVWVFGPVPKCFWEDRQNRRNYLLWLGHKLHFRRMRDWYRLQYEDMAEYSGITPACLYWFSSPHYAVKSCFPDYEWHEWLFVKVPDTFWRNAENRSRYMTWLGEQLGFHCLEDWYRATTKDFQSHQGGGFLLEHRSSVSELVTACFPRHDWKPWLFARSPTNLWCDRKNCRKYMSWLGERLGYRHLDDWYRAKLSDFVSNQGRMLLRRYHDSVAETVIALIPRRAWCEWKFTRVPPGFWDRPENRRRYVLWLGKQLGCRCVEDWSNVRNRNFYEHYGGSLVVMYHSVWDLLEECIPEWDWVTCQKRRHQTSQLRFDQILAWADAYFAEHGKWPNQDSGRIAGVNETWGGVNQALRQGLRGLDGGTSLPRLLNERRGARSPAALPPLSEQQIIGWAKAHFRATGRWPNDHSGAIIESNGESWRTISRALQGGKRGLTGPTTLLRLLQKHGLV
jgi:hypothetical protein